MSTPSPLATYSQATRSWESPQQTLDGEPDQFVGRWPASGMVQNGKLYAAPPLGCLPVENQADMLPTPTRSFGVNARGWGLSKTGRKRYSQQMQDNALRFGYRPPIALLEWMMGFPADHTKLPQDQAIEEASTMQTKFQLHPIASAFPMMNDADYERLRDDIEKNGQQEAIVYWKGMLIDGRNRLKACQELRIEPTECELDESVDPVAYALSANLHRRQLRQSQRAMIAAKMANLKHGQKKSEVQNCTSIEDATQILAVSARSVKAARYILQHGSPALVDAVEQCRVPVSMAEQLCKACPDKKEQTRLVKEGKWAVQEYVSEATMQSESYPAVELIDLVGELRSAIERHRERFGNDNLLVLVNVLKAEAQSLEDELVQVGSQGAGQ